MKLSLLFVALLVPVAVGCAATTQDSTASESEVIAAPIPAGTFNLYETTGYQPNSDCNAATKLVLGDLGAHVELTYFGACVSTIRYDADAHDYPLTRTGSACGSSFYAGSIKRGNDTWSIKLTDHRARTCYDVVPAAIVLEETHADVTTTRYSSNVPEFFEGKLQHVSGIGGESTGAAIDSDKGIFELVLDPAERALFVTGRKARVSGSRTTLSGVETHDRPAIDVSALVVCPAAKSTVDCMPGGEVSPLCEPDNRAWVQASCDGVQYTD